jgi:hypothetical protein
MTMPSEAPTAASPFEYRCPAAGGPPATTLDIVLQGSKRRHDVSPAVVQVIFRHDENDSIQIGVTVKSHQRMGDNRARPPRLRYCFFTDVFMREPLPPATMTAQIISGSSIRWERHAFAHGIFPVIDAGKDLNGSQGAGVALKSHLGDLLFLYFSAGPLNVQDTAGIKPVLTDHQFHLPPKC